MTKSSSLNPKIALHTAGKIRFPAGIGRIDGFSSLHHNTDWHCWRTFALFLGTPPLVDAANDYRSAVDRSADHSGAELSFCAVHLSLVLAFSQIG